MSSLVYQSPWISEELQIFRGTVRRFVQEQFVPQQDRWRQQHQPEAQAWKEAGEKGILLADVPEEYGGGGGSFAHTAIVVEELAHAGVHFGYREQCIVAHYLIVYGTEEQKRKWLPRMARGELVGAIAMTEAAAGSDLAAIRTAARRDGDHYLIHGSKTFITNGRHAGLICLAAKTNTKAPGPTGISLIMVETQDLAGFQVGQPLEKVGQQGIDTCEMFFDEVRVPVSNLLGPAEGKGFSQMMEQLPFERLAIAVSAIATAESALATTSRYVKDRIIFGQRLIDLQNTRFKLAECETEAHIARVFVDHCIERFVAGGLDPVTAAMAKLWVTTSECRIVDECVQLHGGYGYMTEYPIARMWTDSRVHRIGGGTSEIMKEIIGSSL
jgi:acyl-CoA dehydrogenase